MQTTKTSSTPEPKPSQGIKVNDLLLGEHTAMQMAAATWANLYQIDREYLTSLIVKLERDHSQNTRMSLPLFKMILFFAQHLQDHIKSDKELQDALQDLRERNKFRAMFGIDPQDE